MNILRSGQFYGNTSETTTLAGITLTDTEYTHDKVDWHFHENAYFTFILTGQLLEGNKKNTYNCNTGSLIFHNWQEAHYNIKPEGYTRGFHIEIDQKWFDSYGIRTDVIKGSLILNSPKMKMLMYNIFKESKLSSASGQSAIDALLLDLFSTISGINESSDKKRPAWVNKIEDLLIETNEDRTLSELAGLLGIHPVHLSRDFNKYFRTNLGDYIRTIRVQKALSMLPDTDLSLTRIALDCNFADQSHFIRSFKALHQITPSEYRRLLLNKRKC